MPFRFPLQKVLDHRKTLENMAQREFQEAQAEVSRRQQTLEEMRGALLDSTFEAGRVQTSAASDGTSRLKQIHEFQVLQRKRIEIQEAKVREAENLVEEKREILRQKAVDHKIMERLKERRFEEYKADLRDREQKAVDETNVLRHRLKEER